MKDQVIVTFRVAALTERDHNCPGNKQVAYDVLLHEPLGDRVLVDGECLDGAAAADTSFCDPDGVRLRTTANGVS